MYYTISEQIEVSNVLKRTHNELKKLDNNYELETKEVKYKSDLGQDVTVNLNTYINYSFKIQDKVKKIPIDVHNYMDNSLKVMFGSGERPVKTIDGLHKRVMNVLSSVAQQVERENKEEDERKENIEFLRKRYPWADNIYFDRYHYYEIEFGIFTARVSVYCSKEGHKIYEVLGIDVGGRALEGLDRFQELFKR